MTPLSRTKPVYDPATLKIMTDAYAQACTLLPVRFRNSACMRRTLALKIISEVDGGESDPLCLAETAVMSAVRYVNRTVA
jgi:hypothetical protein